MAEEDIKNQLKEITNCYAQSKTIPKGKIYKVVDDIINDKDIGKHFLGRSERYLTKTIESIIKAQTNNTDNNDNNDTVKKIMSELKKKDEKFFCLIPIYGIEVKSIYPKDSNNIAFFPNDLAIEKIESYLNNDVLDKDKIKEFNGPFIGVTLQANNKSTAEELSMNYANSLISVLHVCYSNIDYQYNIGAGYRNTSVSSCPIVTVNSKSKDTYSHEEFYFNNGPAKIPPKKEFDLLFNIVSTVINKKINNNKKNKSTDIENKIYVAIINMAKALTETDNSLCLLYFMTAIESIVENKNFEQNITDQICERCVELLCSNSSDRLKNYKTLKELYDKRSKIIHGETSPKVTMGDLDFLYQTCLELCIHFAMNLDKYKDIKGSKDWKNFFLKLRFEALEDYIQDNFNRHYLNFG